MLYVVPSAVVTATCQRKRLEQAVPAGARIEVPTRKRVPGEDRFAATSRAPARERSLPPGRAALSAAGRHPATGENNHVGRQADSQRCDKFKNLAMLHEYDFPFQFTESLVSWLPPIRRGAHRLLRQVVGKASYGNVVLFCARGNHARTRELPGGERSLTKLVSVSQFPA